MIQSWWKLNPDTGSHAIYTEEDLVNLKGWELAVILFLVISASFIMSFISLFPFIISLLLSSVGIMLFRARYFLLYMKKLREEGKVKFIPKRSVQRKRGTEDQGFILAEVFLPLVLLFLLPIPLNLVIAIGFVIGIPLSILFEKLLEIGLERSLGKVKKFFVWTVLNENDLYLKEYGYLISGKANANEK